MSEITDSLDRLIAVGDACKRLKHDDDSVLYCTSMTILRVGDLMAIKTLRAENERLARELAKANVHSDKLLKFGGPSIKEAILRLYR